jgi:hypothetical protein
VTCTWIPVSKSNAIKWPTQGASLLNPLELVETYNSPYRIANIKLSLFVLVTLGDASLRSSLRPARGVGLQARSPRKFPGTITHRNVTPRCARLRGPGGPHYVQDRTTCTVTTIRQPNRPATTIPHPFPLCVFASLRETLSAQGSKHHNLSQRDASLRSKMRPGRTALRSKPHYVQPHYVPDRTTYWTPYPYKPHE